MQKLSPRRLLVVVSAALAVMAFSVGAAWAVDPTSPAEVITSLSDSTKTNFYSIAPIALALMAVFIAVSLGVRWVKRASRIS